MDPIDYQRFALPKLRQAGRDTLHVVPDSRVGAILMQAINRHCQVTQPLGDI
jgi:hypothetical protein